MSIKEQIRPEPKAELTLLDENIIKAAVAFVEQNNHFNLQQEQPPLPSNLDEVAEEYANKEYPNEPSCGQWGTGDYEPPVDMEYPREIAKDAFKAGAEWQRAKMLEGAIEGRVNQTGFHNSIYIKEPKWCYTLDKFNNGDKVRVIIIKED